MFYVVLLVFLFIVLFTLEFFIPSGGVLGIFAAAALVAAIIIAFTHSLTLGVGTLAIGGLLVPSLFSVLIRVWPRTPVGKRMLNSPIVQDRSSESNPLLHQVGIAKTDLLPNGSIIVNGRRLDAVSPGFAVDRGAVVEIYSVDGGRIHVRPTDRPLTKYQGPEVQGGNETASMYENGNESPHPSLETPLDDFGLEDFLEPPT